MRGTHDLVGEMNDGKSSLSRINVRKQNIIRGNMENTEKLIFSIAEHLTIHEWKIALEHTISYDFILNKVTN